MKKWKLKEAKTKIDDAFHFPESGKLEDLIIKGLKRTKNIVHGLPVDGSMTHETKMPCGDWQLGLASVVSLTYGCSVTTIKTKNIKGGRSLIEICFVGTSVRCGISAYVCKLIYDEITKQSGILRRKIVEVLRAHTPYENRSAVRAFITAYCLGVVVRVDVNTVKIWNSTKN